MCEYGIFNADTNCDERMIVDHDEDTRALEVSCADAVLSYDLVTRLGKVAAATQHVDPGRAAAWRLDELPSNFAFGSVRKKGSLRREKKKKDAKKKDAATTDAEKDAEEKGAASPSPDEGKPHPSSSLCAPERMRSRYTLNLLIEADGDTQVFSGFSEVLGGAIPGSEEKAFAIVDYRRQIAKERTSVAEDSAP